MTLNFIQVLQFTLIKNENKIFSTKMRGTLKLLEIARYRRKTLKKEKKKKKNEEKPNNNNKYFFYF